MPDCALKTLWSRGNRGESGCQEVSRGVHLVSSQAIAPTLSLCQSAAERGQLRYTHAFSGFSTQHSALGCVTQRPAKASTDHVPASTCLLTCPLSSSSPKGQARNCCSSCVDVHISKGGVEKGQRCRVASKACRASLWRLGQPRRACAPVTQPCSGLSPARWAVCDSLLLPTKW